MTLRSLTLSDADIAALVAIRPVVADAHQHPGRTAALEVIDRIATRAGSHAASGGALEPSEARLAEAVRRPAADRPLQKRLVAVPRLPRTSPPASESPSCNRTAVLLGRWHIGGACCQDTRCAACGAAEHHQRRLDSGLVVDHDTACERCDAHRFNAP